MFGPDVLDRVRAATDPKAEARGLSDPQLLAAERALPLRPDDPISQAVYDEIEERGLDL